jgi:beta-lactamase class A
VRAASRRGWFCACVAAAALAAGAAGADDLATAAAPATQETSPGTQWEIVEDPAIRDMAALDRIAPFEDLAPLWDFEDPELQGDVDRALRNLQLDTEVRRQRLAVALIDLTDLDEPRVAAVNGDVMMYAASLPKIAVLLGAFEKIAQGKMALDPETELLMRRMIRESSNEASTELMTRVGKEYIARVLLSPRYRLYDPRHNGGLWVGKDYASAGLWQRDPLHNLSHGATAMQVARFYYLLETGNLVTPEHSLMMKDIMSNTALGHKFVAALRKIRPDAHLFRKSGSWGTFHSDSVLVERRGRSYIAVALSNDAQGYRWLERIIVALDGIIFRQSS